MNKIELREKFGDRTYEAGMKLLKEGAASIETKISDSLCIYRVRDKPVRHVAVWNRKGSTTIECECTLKEMGCRHCACVYMSLFDCEDTQESDMENIRNSINELKNISFNPQDYLNETSRNTLMTQFYNFIQKRIDKRIAHICKSIEEMCKDAVQKEELYRHLWDATNVFESPHDEWSKDTIITKSGRNLYECEPF